MIACRTVGTPIAQGGHTVTEAYLKGLIIELVHRFAGRTAYRTPLVGFARADDPGFERLKKAVGAGHLGPRDLLPGAESVVAFFLPFSAELVRAHRRDPYVSRQWTEAYLETNGLISLVCETLVDGLRKAGARAAWQKPTHNFDPATLVSAWSHKHVAYLCGLGTFGLHHMLITRAGCAGRLGSLVTDAPLKAGPPAAKEHCLHRRGGNCAACVRLCPTGALSRDGLDRQRCYRRLLEVSDYYRDLGLCDVCGRCAVGPCALRVPK
ncbi:MAG: epoxyqueuosine reductase [Bacillota bacterium]